MAPVFDLRTQQIGDLLGRALDLERGSACD